MTKRALHVPILLCLMTAALVLPAPAQALTTTPDYQPDAWIKLCGWGDTCLQAPPHKWVGSNIYNRTGAGQTVSVRMEEGTDVRFWILLQNDGAQPDTFSVKGCAGNGSFVVRVVNKGWLKKASWAPIITGAFKEGTWTTSVPATGTHYNVALTVDIWAKTSVQGATYTCRIVTTSAGDPTMRDVVVGKMITV